MKKIILGMAILIIAVSAAACARQDNRQDNGPSGASMENSVNNQETSLLSAISKQNNLTNNNSAANPEAAAPAQVNAVTPISEQARAAETASVDNKNMINQEKFTDLTKQYSQAIIKTNLGDIKVKFYAADSPFTVNNFLNLAQADFYNGTKFHRVIKDFMIQGGDPLSKESNSALWGTGGPGYKFKDEFNARKLVAGSLAMANSGADTNGSQFFIVTAEATPWLDGHHTNFGEVVAGMGVVRKIEAVETGVNDRPVKEVIISGVELVKQGEGGEEEPDK